MLCQTCKETAWRSWPRFFLDRSVVEIFANDRTCLTGRIYPTLADSLGVDLFAGGGTVKLTSMDIWKMGSTAQG
jgi:beta-fructofuranosidase